MLEYCQPFSRQELPMTSLGKPPRHIALTTPQGHTFPDESGRAAWEAWAQAQLHASMHAPTLSHAQVMARVAAKIRHARHSLD